MSSELIYCSKLKEMAEKLPAPPIPGPEGERIYTHISKRGWSLWLSHQTMLINEYRLSLIDEKAQEFLQQEMEKFLFGEGSNPPEGYQP